MADWKKLNAEEIANINESEIFVAKSAENAEVEAQGVTQCPCCGAYLTVYGNPRYVMCSNCGFTFEVHWF